VPAGALEVVALVDVANGEPEGSAAADVIPESGPPVTDTEDDVLDSPAGEELELVVDERTADHRQEGLRQADPSSFACGFPALRRGPRTAAAAPQRCQSRTMSVEPS
jgi:hypothetical protein